MSKITVKKIQKLLLKDFWKFAKFLNIRREYDNKPLLPNVELYKDLCNHLSNLEKNTLILLPRKHLKTFIVSIFLIWYILKYPNKSVTVICENKDKAQKLLGSIKLIMTMNKNFLTFFGEDLFAKTKNDKYLITLKNRTTTRKEVNIQIYGIEQNLQSLRADLMLFEDVIGKDFIKSKANREMVFTSWEHSQAILEHKAKIIITGTRYTIDDLYNKVLEENKTTRRWNTFVYSIYDKQGNPLCSEVMDNEEIELIKQTTTSSFFSAQYLNNPINSEVNIFNLDSYEFYDDLPDFSYITMAVDLSDGIGADLNALSIVGKSKYQDKFYLIDAFGNDKIDSESLYYKIKEFYNLYTEKCICVLVELNRNGRTIIRDTFKRLNKININPIPFKGIYNSENKNIRIQKLEPLLIYKKLILPSEKILKNNKYLNMLIDELKYFNFDDKNNQDDLLDTLSMNLVYLLKKEIVSNNKIDNIGGKIYYKKNLKF